MLHKAQPSRQDEEKDVRILPLMKQELAALRHMKMCRLSDLVNGLDWQASKKAGLSQCLVCVCHRSVTILRPCLIHIIDE
jgi:hypothetical protein